MQNENPPDSNIVVDSSVWISALQFGGKPLQALQAASESHQIVCCGYIREEVERTLIYKFNWTLNRVRSEMFHYLGFLPDLPLTGRLRGICRDPNDDQILECAVANGAYLILSGDRDLLILHPFRGIQILTPGSYLSLDLRS